MKVTIPEFEYEQWVEEVKTDQGARSESHVHVSQYRELTWGVTGKTKWSAVKTAMKLSKDYPENSQTGHTAGHELRKKAV